MEKKKKENGYEGKNPPEMVEEKLAYLFSVKFLSRNLEKFEYNKEVLVFCEVDFEKVFERKNKKNLSF